MPPSNHVGRGIACAFIGGVCWGFSGNCAEVLMIDYGLDVLWMTPARMLVAAVLFLTMAIITSRDKLFAVFKDGRTMLRLLAYAIFGMIMVQLTYLYAIQFAGAGTALTLQQLGLVFIMLYVCLKARRAPNKGEMTGVVLAALGVIIIATQGDLANLNANAEGVAWGIASAVALAFYNIIPIKPLERYGTPVVNGIGMLIGAIICSVGTRPWEYEVSLPPEGWLVFLGLAVLGTFVAYFLYIQGVKDAGPMRSSLLGCSEPVAGTFISAIWVGTAITSWDILGLIIILAMVFFVVVFGRQSKEL